MTESKPHVVSDGSVLDLPLARQHELASIMGMTHEEWVADMEEAEKKFQEHAKTFKWGVRPEGWTDEDAARFQRKIDSGNPV